MDEYKNKHFKSDECQLSININLNDLSRFSTRGQQGYYRMRDTVTIVDFEFFFCIRRKNILFLYIKISPSLYGEY